MQDTFIIVVIVRASTIEFYFYRCSIFIRTRSVPTCCNEAFQTWNSERALRPWQFSLQPQGIRKEWIDPFSSSLVRLCDTSVQCSIVFTCWIRATASYSSSLWKSSSHSGSKTLFRIDTTSSLLSTGQLELKADEKTGRTPVALLSARRIGFDSWQTCSRDAEIIPKSGINEQIKWLQTKWKRVFNTFKSCRNQSVRIW